MADDQHKTGIWGPGYHLSLAARPRRVPAAERHKWDIKPKRGQTATCQKCGAKKIHQHNYFTVYQYPGSGAKVQQRPPCRPYEPE